MTEAPLETPIGTQQPVPPPSITPPTQLIQSPTELSNHAQEQTTTTDNGSAMAIRTPSSVPPFSLSSRTSDEQATDSLEGKDAADAASIVPPDQVRITLLLVSGSKHTFTFEPSTKVLDVKQHVLENWPSEWPFRAAPHLVYPLELVYRGKFLENNSTLETNRLAGGQSATVHLIIRDQQSRGVDDDNDGLTSKCKCCIIL